MPEPMSPPPDDGAPSCAVTHLLERWRGGDERAFEQLLLLVYDELHRLASRSLASEATGHTIQTTALIHEAYLRLVGSDVEWVGRGHFFAVAARTMRRILVDHARARRSAKRGAGAVAVDIDALAAAVTTRPDEFVALDEAIERLLALDERKARAVELHYFAGLNYDETATALQISPATVHRELRLAKAWLYKELQGDGIGS